MKSRRKHMEKESSSRKRPKLVATHEPVSMEKENVGSGRKDEVERRGDVLDEAYLLGDAPSGATLIERLMKLHACIKEIKHKQSKTGAPNEDVVFKVGVVSRTLIRPLLLRHRSKDIRLLVSCCLVEILRILAPEAPFSEASIREIFDLFIRMVADIKELESSFYSFRLYLLEKLASMKAFVLVCDYEDIVEDVIGCFYRTLKDEHTQKVASKMTSVITSIIEEAEDVTHAVVEALLSPLVRSEELKISSAAVHMARQVLARCQEKLQLPVTKLLNDLHAGTNIAYDSELVDLADDLILELNQISPSYVLYVASNFEKDLLVADEESRRKTTEFLGKFFAQSGSVSAYPSLWKKYHDRFRDVSAGIREDLCCAAGPIIDGQPKADIGDLEDHLKSCLSDTEERVRIAALSAVLSRAEKLSPDTIKSAAGRLIDKRPIVRREALKKLIDAAHARLESVPTESCHHDPLISCLVSSLLDSHRALRIAADFIACGEVERALFNILLFQKDGDLSHLHIVNLLTGLSASQRSHFETLISSRARVRELIRQIVDSRIKKEPRDFSSLYTEIGSLVPIENAGLKPKGTTNSATLVKELAEVRDLHVFRNLRTILDESSVKPVVQESSAEVVRRIGSKTTLGMYLQNSLLQWIQTGVFSKKAVRMWLTAPLSGSIQNEVIDVALWLVDICATNLSDVLEDSSPDLAGVILDENAGERRLYCLRVLARCGNHFHTDKKQFSSVLNTLSSLCIQANGSSQEAKWSCRALATLCCDDFSLPIWATLTDGLNGALQVHESAEHLQSVVCPLTTASELLRLVPKVFERCRKLSEKLAVSILDGSLGADQNWHLDAIQASVKLLRELLCQDDEKVLGADGAEMYMRLLVSLLDKGGDVAGRYGLEPTNPEEREEDERCSEVRLTVGVCLLRVARGKGIGAGLITPSRCLSIALIAHDTLWETRWRFARKINHYLLHKNLPFRWIVCLLLLLKDPDKDDVEVARGFITSALSKYRQLVESRMGRGDANSDGQLLASSPESAIPFIFWIFGHHPEADIDKEEGFVDNRTYIAFFFEKLLSTNGYPGLVLQILNAILGSEDACDDGATEILHSLAKLGTSILAEKRVGRKYKLAEFPGAVPLPQEFYQASKSSTVGDRFMQAAREYDGYGETSRSSRQPPGDIKSGRPSVQRSKKFEALQDPSALVTPAGEAHDPDRRQNENNVDPHMEDNLETSDQIEKKNENETSLRSGSICPDQADLFDSESSGQKGARPGISKPTEQDPEEADFEDQPLDSKLATQTPTGIVPAPPNTLDSIEDLNTHPSTNEIPTHHGKRGGKKRISPQTSNVSTRRTRSSSRSESTPPSRQA